MKMSVYDRLNELHVVLPVATPPVAAFVPTVQTGNLCFVSGHIAKRDGKPWAGQLGVNISTAEGQQAARTIAVDLLATLHHELGDLERVQRIVKLLCLVNSGPAFTEQHLVANGASELLQEVFGGAGKHARSAVGVAQLPLGACVEIELVVEIR
jgi:enamine deaminase RidA (YjgF/YER057c/UK114 family)